ncbi:MAG TPA: tRNA pseudouridine(55) synthase TruB [Galbitalea sp.]|jgi:tRNA pseudouridine55 synthase
MTSAILLVDKPGGLTSHDVVSRVRRLAGTRKVGHAGTLDPMATGLLILGIDSSTRLLTYLVGLDKEYFATIKLGFATTTDDREGEQIGEVVDAMGVTREQLDAAILPLTGRISQVPSSVSAIKVDGKRAYDRVRGGEEVVLRSREVTVSAFEIIEQRGDELDVRVECSSGTYIRALARDLGAFLGVGGHLSALRRTRVGPFRVDDAGRLDEELMGSALSPVSVATRLFPTVQLSDDEVRDLSHGKHVRPATLDSGLISSPGPIAAISPGGRLTGLISTAGGVASVLVNFPTEEVLEA